MTTNPTVEVAESSDTDLITSKSEIDLLNSDSPSQILVSTPLTEFNYLSWNRSMIIALTAKDKIGFIDGTCKKPSADSPLLPKWNRANNMVISWILNCISKDLVEAFLFTKSAKQLWDELEERFSECNGPMMYQIRREITSLTQENMSIVKYYTKMKRFWDELDSLRKIPICSCDGCTCGITAAIHRMDNEEKLMQFLLGLNDSYDHVRNQILLMDPFPSINKAYNMVLNVEKQREVAHVPSFHNDVSAAMAV